MPETTPALPQGWEITTVTITESTSYQVAVAHPHGASPQAIAAAGYDDYSQAEHPETAFDHQVGEDEVSVGGEVQDTWGAPAWATQRPDHETVTSILAEFPQGRAA